MDPDQFPDKHGRAFKFILYDWFYVHNRGAEWAFRDDAARQAKRFWRWSGEGLGAQDRRPPTGMEALGTYSINKYTVRILRCPEPRHFALNHFVAIARKRGRRFPPWKREPDDIRYIALESSTRIIGEEAPPSILGEWTRGYHINYGDGPEPSEEAFVKAIEPILGDQQLVIAFINLADGTYYEPRAGTTLADDPPG